MIFDEGDDDNDDSCCINVQILHRLAARSVIEDWQHGMLSDSSLDQHVCSSSSCCCSNSQSHSHRKSFLQKLFVTVGLFVERTT